MRIGIPSRDQSAGKQKPAVGDIISDGISGFRFEKAHHIIFAQINPGREKNLRSEFASDDAG